MKNTAFLIVCLLATLPVWGQSSESSSKSMDQTLFESFHGHASFNAVFVVLFVILLGILFSLWRLDRKVNKLMKEVKK
jgi:hypothetical protein